jgi:DNA-binding CsgD family transcriptional regulator
MPRPDNTERNARIIELARQGKGPIAIAREWRLSPGIVLGVVHRARKAGNVASQTPPTVAEEGQSLPPPPDAS